MNKERERAILEILLREKSTTVSSLAKRLYASEPSIRRDLNSLESQHFIRRKHGGAVFGRKVCIRNKKIPFFCCVKWKNSDEKNKNCKKSSAAGKAGRCYFFGRFNFNLQNDTVSCRD